tara:strand:- start:1452 stop:1826 length:375 start_codon:yes stop_codon:yes gene_type:complete
MQKHKENDIMTHYKGSCHCGAVAFEIDGDIENIIECNCSICIRRGHKLWFVNKADMKFSTDEEALQGYQFGEKHITHRFCKTCGTPMFSDGAFEDYIKAGINLRCIEDLDLEALTCIQYDGASK